MVDVNINGRRMGLGARSPEDKLGSWAARQKDPMAEDAVAQTLNIIGSPSMYDTRYNPDAGWVPGVSQPHNKTAQEAISQDFWATQPDGGIRSEPPVMDYSGLIDSPVPGRTDQVEMSVEADSYVVPADVVSGLGQGNTQAGAGLLEKIFQAITGGGRAPPVVDRVGPDYNPRDFARGGGTRKSVPIVAAGGEFVITPAIVRALGGGDAAKGHKLLDRMVKQVRQTAAKRMMKLPGPKKD